jgi:hypothetical protein
MLVRSWRSSSPWLHGLSPEEQASIDGRLIHDHRGLIEEPPSGGFSFDQSSTALRFIQKMSSSCWRAAYHAHCERPSPMSQPGDGLFRSWHFSDVVGLTDDVGFWV